MTTEPQPDETVTLTIPRYRDPDGNPTCCADVASKRFCRFLFITYLGCADNCSAIMGTEMFPELTRRDNGEGYIEPHRDCPLWQTTTKREYIWPTNRLPPLKC